jgi:hypothetical protein
MTFSNEQQQLARDLFIEECRPKAWGAACNADYVGNQHDKPMADYEKLQKEDAELEVEIKALDSAINTTRRQSRRTKGVANNAARLSQKQKEGLSVG